MSSVVKGVVGAVLIAVGSYFGQGWLINIGASLLISASPQSLEPRSPAEFAELNDDYCAPS